MVDQNLKVRITGDASKLVSALKQANTKVSAFGTAMKNAGRNLSIGLTLPLAVAGGAAIKFASDFQESMNKVDVAFGNSKQQVKDFAQTTLKQFGIAEGSALDMAALFGDMATSMGLTRPAAADMSTSLVGLAGDLASFKNIGIDQATTALAGVFTGETESLKKLGIVMTEANLKQFAMEQGIASNIKTMSQAEKVALRYQFIIAKTANAQGDFGRTSDGAANQMRIFQESLKELSAKFGQVILPMFTKLVSFANGLLQKFSELSPTTKKLIIVFAGIAAALGPVLYILGTLVTLAPAIGTALTVMMGPIGLIIAGLTAIAVVIYKNWAGIKQALVDVANYFIELYNSSKPFQQSINYLIYHFKSALVVGKFVFQTLIKIVKLFANAVHSSLGAVGDILVGIFTGNTDKIQNGINTLTNGISSSFTTAFDEIKTDASSLGTTLLDELKESLKKKTIAPIVITAKTKTEPEEESKTDDTSTTNTVTTTPKFDPEAGEKLKALNAEINQALITNDAQAYQQRKLETQQYYDDLISKVAEGSEQEKELQRAKTAALTQIDSEEKNRLLEIKQQFADATNLSDEEQKVLEIEKIKAKYDELRQLAADNNLLTVEQQKAFDTAQAEAENAVYNEKKARFMGFTMSLQQAMGAVQQINSAVGQSFAAVGNSIGNAFGGAKSALGAFVGTLAKDALKIVGHNLKISMSNAVTSGSETAKSFGPAAAFMLPALIAGATALISRAFSSFGGGGGGGRISGNIGGGSVNSGAISGGGGVTAFANGGIISGPTMGLVGEYPGAKSNPEVISPLNKLKSLIGDSRMGGNLNVTGEVRVDGQDLLIAIQRAQETADRIYGG